VPGSACTLRLERHDPGTGAWVVVDVDDASMRVRSGTTGNRVDPTRRVPRTCWELRRVAGDLELLATWPVSELVTHRIGEQVEQLVDDLAAAGGDPTGDLDRIGAALDPLLGPAAAPALDGRLWSAAHPLLRVPVAAGATLRRVPVALDRVLRADDPRAAARLAFGRVTRPLVRALAESLLPAAPGRPVPFEPALLALMASPWVGPERLVEVLRTPVARPGAVAFDVGDVDRSRPLFEPMSPRQVTAHLVAALTEPDGTLLLAERIAAWRPPAPAPAPAAPAAARRAAPPPAPTAVNATPRQPPRTDLALRHPDDLRQVDGLVIAHLVVRLPRTADDLLRWGRELANCLGSYRHAVAEGRSHVLGLCSADGRLRYALELTRGRVVRQLEAPGNRQAPDHVADRVIAELRARGVVRADGRRGRSLLAPR